MLLQLAAGRIPCFIDEGYWWSDPRDVADVVANATGREESPSVERVYFALGRFEKIAGLARLCSRILGRNLERPIVPFDLAFAGLPFLQFHAALRRRPPLYTRNSLHLVRDCPADVDHGPAEAELGYVPPPPGTLHPGCAALVSGPRDACMSGWVPVFPVLAWVWAALSLPIFAAGLAKWDPVERLGVNARGPRLASRQAWFWMELPALFIFPLVYAAGRTITPSATSWLPCGSSTTPTAPSYGRGLSSGTIERFRLHCASRACRSTWSRVVVGLVHGVDRQLPTRLAAGPAFPCRRDTDAGGRRAQHLVRPPSRPGATGCRRRLRDPRGGAFEYLSCPNLLGEIMEWTGLAVLTWCVPALGFALWTAANLVPRALWRHRWYRETFPDYPRSRRAILPWVL